MSARSAGTKDLLCFVSHGKQISNADLDAVFQVQWEADPFTHARKPKNDNCELWQRYS